MKKILFVIPTLRMGGAEKALVSLLRSLDPEDAEVDLFLFEQGGVLQKMVPSWVRILPENVITRAMLLEFRFYWFGLIRSGHLLTAARRLWAFIKAHIHIPLHRKNELYWAKTAKTIPALEGEYDIAIGFLEGVTDFYVIDKVTARKKIGWIHTDFAQKQLSSEEVALYRKFDHIATITPTCADSFRNATGISPDRVTVVENITIPEDIISASQEDVGIIWDKSIRHIVTVSRLEKQKGVDLALEACMLLQKSTDRFCWHILGDGSLRSWLESEIATNGLGPYLILEGSKENPYPYMKNAYVIVQPSRTEGKSIVLDEAKILGKAIITTNYPSVIDQITDGKNGLITEISANSIAEKIKETLNHPELVRRLEIGNAISGVSVQDKLLPFLQLIS